MQPHVRMLGRTFDGLGLMGREIVRDDVSLVASADWRFSARIDKAALVCRGTV